MNKLRYLLVLISTCLVQTTFAGGFFEVGQVTLNTTIDNGGWVTITLVKTYVNPIIIAGPVTHNNELTLSPRVMGMQIGMQSPCESLGSAVAGISCPPANWLAETITYMIIEEGVWEFPDETEIEADFHSTSTVRDNVPGNPVNTDSIDLLTFKRTAFDSVPTIVHTVNSFNDPTYIASVAWGTVARTGLPTTTQFSLGLEGLEAVETHSAENIAWIAIEQVASGINAGTNYDSGSTGLIYDRHNDACTTIANTHPFALAQVNSMAGGNGSVLRYCNGTSGYHVDEDQVNDIERTGIPERIGFFSYADEEFGNLVFLTATQTVSDDNGGLAGPGDTLTYTITITNELNDFTQDNNAGDEMTIPLPPNTTLVGGSLTQTSGTLSGTGPLTWNGSVTPGQVITLTYQVTIDSAFGVCNTDLENQATLHMDPNGDGVNSIDEISDDPSRNDGIDTDMDNGSDNAALMTMIRP